jgi:hypothetical protein
VSHPVADIFLRAAELNHSDPQRQGNTVRIEGERELIVCGDIHGQRALLARIIKHANLAAHAQRILVLQELLHGEVDPKTGKDRSIELLMRAARLKVAHPDQVLFVLSNHDLAQITGREVSKRGRTLCKQFTEDVVSAFEVGGDEVLAAVLVFLRSLPLAIRTAGEVLIAHSIPSPNRTDEAGIDILDRESVDEDLLRGGAVYEWTWGRDQHADQIEALAQQIGVEFFLLSHRPVERGFEVISPRAAAITSEDASGCIATFPNDQTLSGDSLPDVVTPLGLV